MTTPPKAPSLILVRADSDSTHVRFLAGLNNPDHGVLSVRSRPTARRFGWLARSILEAVGKDRNAAGKARNDTEDEAFLPAWLTADDITDLVVTGAEVIPERILHDLASLTFTVGIRTWLVADHHLPEAFLTLANHWPVQAMTASDFNTYWETHSSDWRDTSAPTPVHHDVAVPSADFAAFYAELTRLLPEDQASALRAGYRDEFAEASTFIATLGTELSEDSIATYVRQRFTTCPTEAEMITTVRAVQAAAFHHYWFVKVDFSQLVATGSHQLSALISNPNTWRTLRAYRQTYRPAVCALVAAGLDLATIRDLPASAVSDDYSTVTVDGHTHQVPEDARPLLRAHAIWRNLNIRSDRFIALPDRTHYSVRRLRRALDDAATEYGFVFSPGVLTRNKVSARHWAQRHGISVRPLDRPSSSASKSGKPA